MIWLANPYLALLVCPAAHVWLLAARAPGRGGRAGAVALALLACVPAALALVAVAGALDLGLGGVWTFTIMVADGQIGLTVAACVCFLAGAVAAAGAMAARGVASGSAPGAKSLI